MTVACVVCGASVSEGDALYANTWERARRRYPCCTEACCRAFDPDVHWLPAVQPEPATEDEQRRLLGVARGRLVDGDNPSIVARELLLAGVAVPALTKVLRSAHVASTGSARDARQRSVIGILAGIFSVVVNSDRRSPAALEDALIDLERWDRHWGLKSAD